MLEEELKGASVDVGAIEEWRRKDAEYRGRLTDLEAATQARNQVQSCHLLVTWPMIRLFEGYHARRLADLDAATQACIQVQRWCQYVVCTRLSWIECGHLK